MHIPDGYLSPKTCVAFFAGMIPVWYIASKRVEATVGAYGLPMLALGAAFTFVIMMFNIPVPGGTSGHMVGAVVVAIALGPWAGVAAVTLTVALQAFLFGDGGLTALGANAFNMAFVMCFAGYYVYRVISAGSPGRTREFAATAVAAYLAVNLAALAVAFELGIQPLIAHANDGRPLYAPYPLSITIPAMMIPHLLFFGPVEGLGTALAISYMRKTGMSGKRAHEGRGLKPLWVVVVMLIILTPLGLIAGGAPWGEWTAKEFSKLIGYVPAGMDALSGRWSGLVPGYGASASGGMKPVLYYMFSAAIGSAAVVFAIYLWGRVWRR